MDPNSETKQALLTKILKMFVLSLLVASIGLFFGQFVPNILMLPLMIVEIGMIIAAVFIRKKNIMGFPFLFIFVFISGITTYPIVYQYGSALGANIVFMAFTLTLIFFIAFAFVGWVLKKDLSFLGSILFFSLLGLVIFMLLGLFFPQSDITMFIISIIAAILFSVYIVYDFNQIKHRDITEEEVPGTVLNLYLDFVNLFIHILRILGFLADDD